jgi:hypothetical protein
MFVKNAISWFGQKLCATKDPTFTKQLLMPLLLLVSVLNWLISVEGLHNTMYDGIEIVRCPSRNKKSCWQSSYYSSTWPWLNADLRKGPKSPSWQDPLLHSASKKRFYIQGSDGTTIFVRPRPYVNEFLTAAASIFTLYVYTAGKKAYADAILDVIDTQRLIKKRFYRDSCVAKNRSFVKNLNKLPKDGPMFLVDDNPESIRLNTPNSLLVKSF